MAISYWRVRDRYYRLIGSRCEECGYKHFPSMYRCRKCGSGKVKDHEMPKTGRIVTYTVLHEASAGFEHLVPYALCIARLQNGVKVLGQIVDTPLDQLAIGDKVKIVFRRAMVDGPSGQIFYGYKFVKS